MVAVLAIILMLSFLVTRFMDEALDDLEYRAIFNEPTDVRSFAFSMLEVALATIHEVALIDDGKLYAPEQGWGRPIEYAGIQVPHGWEVDITIQDESGKLPINTMSERLLNRMLEESLDFDFSTARRLSSVLLDWIDSDDIRRLNGAESDDYLARNPPYRAANGPLQSLDELRLLFVWEDEFFDDNGAPNERFEKLSQMVSVLNTGPINMNSAPQNVLALLALEDGWLDAHVFDGLDDPYLKTVPAAASASTTGVEATLLRVTVRLQRGSVPFLISALVEPNFGDGRPPGAQGAGSAPDRSSDDEPKTGALSEQDAIQYPFKILQLSEYSQGRPPAHAARYSAVDIHQ